MRFSFENYGPCVQALRNSINGGPISIDTLILDTEKKGFKQDHIKTAIAKLMVGENEGKYQQEVIDGKMYIKEVI